MAIEIDWLGGEVKRAVKDFWRVRAGGDGVLSGKTLDEFVNIMRRVVNEYGLPNASICNGRCKAEVPGYFRPHKSWDTLVIDDKKLVAALELKSQVGSIGNNFNNRTEEVLGSSLDLKTAIEEDAFGSNPNIFTGYIIVVEDSEESRTKPYIGMKHFPVMPGFLDDEGQRDVTYKPLPDGSYPRATGISYINRYDVMCKRLMLKGYYTAAAVITASKVNADTGEYGHVTVDTSIEAFMIKLANHCQNIAALKRLALGGTSYNN
ncbi:PaeR7I family type II restriction endonuclease [Geobacter sulfurreducens]|uniref:PaeR7I family type II restriction endonuclease n=1 Tax=Geobacter sulfurreducens TaxID=35554 RepID=UPI000DBB050B|nr:PaeR7I family type II restriction endonuclease [Geobacter sulfurreducens]BBA71030.1 Type-2 restriction enzyme PaeR7I [Geobacter sulfurreducens]